MKKKKIINDPVYGFITIPDGLIFQIISHPFFQRLRRIKQMGLNDFVYPGALHTRFHHALGAMHLMSLALQNLQKKGHAIDEHEFESLLAAILLHDIGHGPLSHALESTLLQHGHHESVSLLIMQYLNRKFPGKLQTAIDIFQGKYPRPFFHELVASQLDIDRLDYLRRDSFFTGVSEGTIGANRIIQMLDLKDDCLVVEQKGIYSIENFLSARRLMYWQVYLHKTSLAAEKMMVQLVSRAQHLARSGGEVDGTTALLVFLRNPITVNDLESDPSLLECYCQLDDYDIWSSIKQWQHHSDPVLSRISQMFLSRDLFQIRLGPKPADRTQIEKLKLKIASQWSLDDNLVDYLVCHGSVSNAAYISGDSGINILMKDGTVNEIADASDLPNIKALSKIVKKYYLCWPKSVTL